MVEVGVRELKNALSRYLRRVKGGEIVVVTERGEPVARIVPANIPEDLSELVVEGRVSWSGGRARPPRRPVRLRSGPPLSQYISEDRR